MCVYECEFVHMRAVPAEARRGHEISRSYSRSSFSQDRVSLSGPSCLGTHSVHNVGFELTEIYLPLLSSAMIILMHHHCLPCQF